MPLEKARWQPGQVLLADEYDADVHWCKKPLTPAQILVHDVRLERLRPHDEPTLEIHDRVASSLIPATAAITPSSSYIRAANAARNPIEQQRFYRLEEDFGWLRHLGLRKRQVSINDSDDTAKCRWIHCSSKFPEYLPGFLYALLDERELISDSLRVLDAVVEGQSRFSKHGRYFAPFHQPLIDDVGSRAAETYPAIICTPFLDWSVAGRTPPLRFQIDRREGRYTTKSSAHPLRSLLQYFYRLEDTMDREKSQVLNKHKPWTTNRDMDLRVRQFYGAYPSALVVDELWILAIDDRHVVTFSANQTWKSRWPPLQLSSRIANVAFRDAKAQHRSQSIQEREYTARMHAIVSLSGAVGMMHRNFWPDVPLCLTDRYAGHLSHLQYRLHRSPSTKLLMDLIACQDELNIVMTITQQQLDLIRGLRLRTANQHDTEYSPQSRSHGSSAIRHQWRVNEPAHRQLSTSNIGDPLEQLVDNLSREMIDLQDLRDSANALVTRTIQLVNIRLEDHGKAILVFTVVTIIFLPLNFVSSFFGMNFSDIRDMTQTQSLFWIVAICVTAGVGGASIFLAFQGGSLLEKMLLWRDSRKENRSPGDTTGGQTFTGTDHLAINQHIQNRNFRPMNARPAEGMGL